MLSFWWNFNHWLHRKLSFWQLSVQPVMKISSKWRHFCFSGCGSGMTLKHDSKGFSCGVSNHQQLDSFFYLVLFHFVQQLARVNIKENIKSPQLWPFVGRIKRSRMDSCHEGPEMRKIFPRHDVIMIEINLAWQQSLAQRSWYPLNNQYFINTRGHRCPTVAIYWRAFNSIRHEPIKLLRLRL